MYAVILVKGKQYRVEEGEKFAVDKINAKEGSPVSVDKVLAIEINGEHLFGVEAGKAQIKAKVVEHFRDDKITVFKYKSKNRYRRTLGHKQKLTMLEIEEINVPGIEKPKKVEKPKKAPKTEDKTKKKETSEKKDIKKDENKKLEKAVKKEAKPEKKSAEIEGKVDKKPVDKDTASKEEEK